MNFLKKTQQSKKVDEEQLKYKAVPLSPSLLQRQYEEDCYKKYNITKKHECITK